MVTDEFWQRVEPLVPQRALVPGKQYVRSTSASPEQAGRQSRHARFSRPSCLCCGLAEYDDMQGIAWRWQSVDGAMMKTPLAQEAVGPNPTDLGKNGSNRHLLVGGRGIPLSLVVSGANVHDCKRLDAVLSANILHVVGRRKAAEIKRRDPQKKAGRWVVEVCHSWFNRFHKLLVRYEKFERSFLALNHLAAAIIAFRKVPLSVNKTYG